MHIFFKSLVVGALSLSIPFFVSAEEIQPIVPVSQILTDTNEMKPIVLATVNLQNATSTQEGHTFTISFDLTNRVGVQPGVKYSVVLIKETAVGQTIVDEHVYDETINLGENSSVHKVVNYAPPTNIVGEYLLFISSENTSGFPFGQATLGKVILKRSDAAQNPIVIDTVSCYLTVEGEKDQPHYAPRQGVDISIVEKLQSNCIVENTSNVPTTATPSFVTRTRSNFGEIVSTQGGDMNAVIFAPNEKKTIVTSLPISLTPQSYNVNLKYGATSNEISYHYVIQGAGGTIQNILLDKDAYVKGETANISFMWSPSADGFPYSRQGASTQLTSPSFAISLVDETGNSCANSFNQPLLSDDILVQAKIAIISSCIHPRANVTLADAKLGVLAQMSFETATTPSPSIPQKETNTKNILAVMLVILLSVIFAFLIYRNKKVHSLPVGPLVLLFVIGFMFTHAEIARADTFYTGFTGTTLVNVSLNKTSYAPGEPMTITGSITVAGCANSGDWYLLKYGVDLAVGPFTGAYLISQRIAGGSTIFSSATVPAPLLAGSHRVNFLTTTGWVVSKSYFLPFTVNTPSCTGATPCGTPGSCFAKSGCNNVCGSTAVNDCAGTCGGGAVDYNGAVAGCGFPACTGATPCGTPGSCFAKSGCNNVCGSTAVNDCAGTCGGSAVDYNGAVAGCGFPACTGATPCGTPGSCFAKSGCNNVCGSTAVNDCAGTCGGGAVDYNGAVAGCGFPACITANPVAPITLPTTTFTSTYSLTNGTSANTNCRLLDNASNPLTGYTPCSGSIAYNTPASPGAYGYNVQAFKSLTGEIKTSAFTVTVNGAGCSATTIENCALPATATGGNAGSCNSGYVGSCNFSCMNRVWSSNSNSCTLIPAPIVTATINGAATASIGSGAPFTLAMTSSGVGGGTCSWSRSSVANNLGGDFGFAAIPTANGGPQQFNTNNVFSGWRGPTKVTWIFKCDNGFGLSTSRSVELTIAAPVPAITINPINNLLFGDVPLNNTRIRTFTITNTGDIGSWLIGTVTTGNPRFVCTERCTYDLGAGEVQTVTVIFTPGVVGPISASVLFNGNPSPTLISSGNGIAPVIIVPASVDFGNVPIIRTKDLSFVIKNIGTVDLGLTTFWGYNAPYTCISMATCAQNGINLAPNVVNTVTLRFSPTAAIVYPTQIGTLSGQPLYAIPISGTGVQPVFNVKEQ